MPFLIYGEIYVKFELLCVSASVTELPGWLYNSAGVGITRTAQETEGQMLELSYA
jgi:hypothetical protein